ncbi:hypothetical protein ACHAPU_010877 [Fusarium lateritium]
MPLDDALKQLVGIIADVFLSTVGNVGGAIIDVLCDLASTAMDILNTKIHIPAISYILNALGVQDISMLDLFCWIPAVGYTVVYKIANNSAPLPDNADVNSLINADSQGPSQTEQPPGPSRLSIPHITPISNDVKRDLYISCHGVGAIIQCLSIFVNTLEIEGSSNKKDNPFSKPKSILGGIHSALWHVSSNAVSQDPINSVVLEGMNDLKSAVNAVASFVLGQRQKYIDSGETNVFLQASDGRAIGAMISVVLGYWGMAVSAGHLYELSKDSADSKRTAAILMEVSSMLGQIGTVAYCEAANDSDPTTKQVLILVMGAVGFVQAGSEASLCGTV